MLNKLLFTFIYLEFQCQIIIQDLTKRNRQLENENANLQKRCDELAAENNGLRADKAALEAECHRLKVANAELMEKCDNLQRENNNLTSKSLFRLRSLIRVQYPKCAYGPFCKLNQIKSQKKYLYIHVYWK